jgi:hypothetical protein
MRSSLTFAVVSLALPLAAVACSSARPGVDTVGSGSGSGTDGTASPSGSEVGVSMVSGALNNNSETEMAWNDVAPRTQRKTSALDRALTFLNPIRPAYAASWTCSGDTLTPSFDGPSGNPYSFTPATCKITWLDKYDGTSSWSGPFTLDYGSSCDSVHPKIENQAASCEVTRKTATGGVTRTITGPDGNSYAIDHDTNGAGTGWDSTVTPAPTDGGVQVTCGGGGEACLSSRTLVINGSHLTGTVDIDGHATKIWDHTVSTGEGGITVTGAGADRIATGTVTVQHNLLKYTSTTTFTNVHYGDPACCFPTAGSVSTTYSEGAATGKTETLTFTEGGSCGEATLVDAKGNSTPLTLLYCL